MADGDQPSKNQGGGETTVKANAAFKPRRLEGQRDRMVRRAAGKRSRTKVSRNSGRYVSSRPAKRVTDLALDATLREAAIYQRERRAEIPNKTTPPSRRVILRRADLRQKVRVRKTRNAVCFVVDASWSMLGWYRSNAIMRHCSCR
jgi:Mg-chelatase subunit ChlD